MINLTVVKSIIMSAALSGLIAGLLLTGIQEIDVLPTLLKAEHYEQSANSLTHSHGIISDSQKEWQPENGIQRTFYTGISNISLAFSFALLLGAAMLVYGKSCNWRSGLLWGLAGYSVFVIAPSLGLPPELPGTEAAALQDRQAWWLLTVLATASGLSLLVFVRSWPLKSLGILVLLLPHLMGAPQPQVHGSTAPLSLVYSFIYATAIANAIFWLSLGGLQGFFYKKLASL